MTRTVKAFLLLLSGIGATEPANAYTVELPYDLKLYLSGYLGWRQILSDVQFSSIPSSPEMGLTSGLRITNRLSVFNQFQWGTSLSSAAVYNHIAYTLPIPIDDLDITFKAGKLRYDNLLYSITKINPRTRQGVFQPQALYFANLAESITSGLGIGIDFNYGNFSGAYVVDQQTITDHVKTAKAWSLGLFDNMRSRFGGHQMVSLQYEFPDEGLRLKTSFNKLHFSTVSPIAHAFGVEYFTGGIELCRGNWRPSFEGLVTKREGLHWGQTNRLSYGYSGTVEYDMTAALSLRVNYNRYQSQTPSRVDYQRYTKDLNLGLNWHQGNWMSNIEGHWIRGGRAVDSQDFTNDPEAYRSFFVVGINAAYFFD